MNCLYLRQNASAYLDHQLSSQENQEFLLHMNSCTDCFDYVDDIRHTTQLLKQLGSSVPPPDLAPNIIAQINAAHICKPANPKFGNWLVNTFFYVRPQYVSYATGFVVTCLLFATVMYSFRPAFIRELQGHVSVIWTPGETIDLPLPDDFDTSPSVQSSRALSDLAKAHALAPEQDLFLVADVDSKGRAELVQIVDSSKNQKVEKRVVNVLKRTSFKPGTKDGRPVNSRLFLLIQTIDVRG